MSIKEARKIIRIVQNSGSIRSQNLVTGVLDHSKNVPKKISEQIIVQTLSIHIVEILCPGNEDEYTVYRRR